ncbi:MAG: segregation/condensation protein A [bacterium]|nr:segregation/condensation protein A [bacterium]
MSENVADNTSEDYRVNLEVFSGPLDLLLYLIKTEEVDIYDIPIARITRQYLRYIDMMTTLDLEVAGEFILMAATLIRIKTRLLLPHDENDPEEHDPREELIMALVEYKKYKEAGEILRDRALAEEQVTIPPSPVEKIEGRVELTPMTGLYDLVVAFRDVVSQKRAEVVHEVVPEEVSIEERMEVVLSLLAQKESVTFVELFADVPRRMVAIVTFIALLELTRDRRVRMYQAVPFSEVRVYRTERTLLENTTVEMVETTNTDVQGVIS